jgi:SPP1 gp7 family putative phage head morphogenesis protein
MGRGKRFEAMRDKAAERLLKANQIACEYIKGETPDIFAVNLNHMAYGLEKEYGNIGFTLYNEEMVRKLIAEEADMLPAPSINVPKDLWWNKNLITAEMTSGILQGESIGKLADRFQHITDANRVSAIRNARTFCTAAENAGRQEGFNKAAAMGIKVKKQWVATLDNRTRHSHRALDGQIVDYNKPFISNLGSKMMHPGDKNGAVAGDLYNCRCTMITVEKESIVAEEVKRRAENEVISNMTYKEWEQWKKAQSDD